MGRNFAKECGAKFDEKGNVIDNQGETKTDAAPLSSDLTYQQDLHRTSDHHFAEGYLETEEDVVQKEKEELKQRKNILKMNEMKKEKMKIELNQKKRKKENDQRKKKEEEKQQQQQQQQPAAPSTTSTTSMPVPLPSTSTATKNRPLGTVALTEITKEIDANQPEEDLLDLERRKAGKTLTHSRKIKMRSPLKYHKAPPIKIIFSFFDNLIIFFVLFNFAFVYIYII